MIEVDHLVKACEGDPLKLSGLAVLIAMASYALGRQDARTPDAPLDSTNQQLAIWHRAMEEIEKHLLRSLVP